MPSTTSFDNRIVRYEDIHNVHPDQFAILVDAIAVQDCYRILDCGCGYGAVSREILSRTDEERQRNKSIIAIDLVDESQTQLNRAREELKRWVDDPLVKLEFHHGTFPDNFGWSKRYDAVAAKMVLHEVPREKQRKFVSGLYECLKDNGRLILWDLALTPETAEFFRETIKTKDVLAGFETLVSRRYFLSNNELLELLDRSPFAFCKQLKQIDHKVETRKRLLPELRGDENLLAQWHERIRGMASAASPALLEALHYVDEREEEMIRFQVNKVIFICRKTEVLNSTLNPFTPGRVTLNAVPNRAAVYPDVVKQSFADGNLRRVLRSHLGLIRTSLLTRAYGGERELCREGLDYLCNAGSASSAAHIEAYVAHLTWLYYGRKNSLRSRRIRSISDALSEAFRNTASAAWMTVSVIDDRRLDIRVGTPIGVEGRAIVLVPRQAKSFFEYVMEAVRSRSAIVSEPLNPDASIQRLRTASGKSIDQAAIDLAANLPAEWTETFNDLGSIRIEIEWLIENVHLRTFLDNSKEVLVPLLEFLIRSGMPTLHYLLPPTLTTMEQGRLEEGVFILSTDCPLEDDSFLQLLAFVAGLWSGLGALEAETAGRQAQEEHEATERSKAVAGFTHQVGHVLGVKSGVPPFHQFADWLTSHNREIALATQETEDLALRAAQVRYASILPSVFAATLERLTPKQQDERMWKKTETVRNLVERDVWNGFVLSCAKAMGRSKEKFGTRGREPQIVWANECGATFVPKDELVEAILFEILWNACRHGNFEHDPSDTALIHVETRLTAGAVELAVKNPTREAEVKENCCQHLKAFVETLKSWTGASKAKLFEIRFSIEMNNWITRLTLPVQEPASGATGGDAYA